MKIVVSGIAFLQRCVHLRLFGFGGVFGGQKMKPLCTAVVN